MPCRAMDPCFLNMRSTPSSAIGIQNGPEFLPAHGYDVPGVQKLLAVRLEDAEIRLSERHLAELSSSDVRKVLQGYIKEFESCMRMAEESTGSIETIMVRLRGLVNEAVAFGVLAGIASENATRLWQLVPLADDQHPAWGALNLSDEQERLLLALRCTYLWSSSQPLEGDASAGKDVSMELQMQVQRNRQRCLFTDRALREVLNPMQAAIAFTLARPDFPDMLPVAHRLAALREKGQVPGGPSSTPPTPVRSVPQSPPSPAGSSRSFELSRLTWEGESEHRAPSFDAAHPREAADAARRSVASTGNVARSGPQHAKVDAFTLSSWIGTAHVSSSRSGSSASDASHVSPRVASQASGQDLASALARVTLEGESRTGEWGASISVSGPVCGEIEHHPRPSQGRLGSMEGFSGWGRPKLVGESEAAVGEGFLGSKYGNAWRGSVETSLEAHGSCSAAPALDLHSLVSSPVSAAGPGLPKDASGGSRPPCGETADGCSPFGVPLSPFSFAPSVPQFACATGGTAQYAPDVSSMGKVRSVSLSQWLEPQAGVPGRRADIPKYNTAPPVGDTTELEGAKLKNFLSLGSAQANHPPDPSLSSSFRHNLLGGWRPSLSAGLGQVGSPAAQGPARSVRATALTPPRSLDHPGVYAVGQVPLQKRSASGDFQPL